MSVAATQLRALKIKCDVVTRLRKDLDLYRVEAMQQKQHIESMIARHCDAYEVRKQQEVLDETLNLLPDCQTRLDAAVADLLAEVRFFLDEHAPSNNNDDDSDDDAARALLERAQALLLANANSTPH